VTDQLHRRRSQGSKLEKRPVIRPENNQIDLVIPGPTDDLLGRISFLDDLENLAPPLHLFWKPVHSLPVAVSQFSDFVNRTEKKKLSANRGR
jgi:hypothetical protein